MIRRPSRSESNTTPTHSEGSCGSGDEQALWPDELTFHVPTIRTRGDDGRWHVPHPRHLTCGPQVLSRTRDAQALARRPRPVMRCARIHSRPSALQRARCRGRRAHVAVL